MKESTQEMAYISKLSGSEGRKFKKNVKKVTWSSQLETVRVLTPEIGHSKFRVFRVREEEEGDSTIKTLL